MSPQNERGRPVGTGGTQSRNAGGGVDSPTVTAVPPNARPCPCGCATVAGAYDDPRCARHLAPNPATAYRRQVHYERLESGRYVGSGWAGGRSWPRPDGIPTSGEVLYRVADARAAQAEEYRVAGDTLRWAVYTGMALALRDVGDALDETDQRLAG